MFQANVPAASMTLRAMDWIGRFLANKLPMWCIRPCNDLAADICSDYFVESFYFNVRVFLQTRVDSQFFFTGCSRPKTSPTVLAGLNHQESHCPICISVPTEPGVCVRWCVSSLSKREDSSSAVQAPLNMGSVFHLRKAQPAWQAGQGNRSGMASSG